MLAAVLLARLHATSCALHAPEAQGSSPRRVRAFACRTYHDYTTTLPPQVCYLPFASMARGEAADAVGAVTTTGAMAQGATPTAETAEAPSAARVVCKVRASA